MDGDRRDNVRSAENGKARPLSIIEWERADQRRLCAMLDWLADSAAGGIDRAVCERAFVTLSRRLPVYHRNEEAVFALLAARGPGQLPVAEFLELVRQDHAAHDCYAMEFGEVVLEFDAGFNPGSVAAMLRGFSGAIRRHLAFEDSTLMAMARTGLGRADMVVLTDILAMNRMSLGPVAVDPSPGVP